jgi:phosphate-selective porin OprO/OprP
MKLSKLTLAVTAALAVSASSNAFAINLYVDMKTKQIYAEPGKGRVLMGEFEKVGDRPQATAPANHEEIAAIRQDLELKNNSIKALEEKAIEAESVKVKLDDGLEFKSKDGNFSAALHGRLQLDSQVNLNQNPANPAALSTSTTNQLANGAAVRRARLAVNGTFFKDWDYKFEYDFTRGNGSAAGGVTDAFVAWNGLKDFDIKVGQFKEPFSLEEATSNRFLTFIERNMAVNTFIDNLNTYKMGVGAHYADPGSRWQAATSFQTEPVGISSSTSSNSSLNANGNANRNNGSGDTNWEGNVRVSGTPWMESNTKLWAIGSSGSYMHVNNNYTAANAFSNGGIDFVTNPNTNVDRTNVLDTGNLTTGAVGSKGYRQANSLTRFGAETAVVYGPFSAQSEYIRTDVSGQGYGSSTAMDGFYGYATYFLTGESRNYKAKTGTWDRIKPNQNFDMKGGLGAWELAAGYDYINLNSGVIQGGRASTAKVGINWYPNSHVRLMANYVHALDINSQAAATVRAQGFNNAALDIFETRVQLDF